MKKPILFISILLLSGLVSIGQDVQFSPAVISSGGSSHSNGAVTVSRWRIGQINVITLPSDENAQKMATVVNTILPVDSLSNWTVTLFPNPVLNKLNVRFDMATEGEFTIELFDVTGRKMMSEKKGIIFPGQVTELDFSQFAPALYLLKIMPSDEGPYKQFKITKQ